MPTTALCAKSLVATFTALLIALSTGSAFALGDDPMRFTLYQPCYGNSSACGTRIFAKGVIGKDTPQLFQRFLATEGKSVSTMVFDSPGGSIGGAIELGRSIRQRKIDVELAPSYEREDWDTHNMLPVSTDAVCASACTVAFAGGVRRTVVQGSRFGVHQFSAATGQIGDGSTQVAMVTLSLYLQEMGVDRRLLDLASLVDPASIVWLKPDQINELQIDNTHTLATQEWAIKALDSGEPLLLVDQLVGPGKRVRIGLFKKGVGGLFVAVRVLFDSNVVGRDRTHQFPTDGDPGLGLSVDGKPLAMTLMNNWTRREEGETVTFTCTFGLARREAERLGRAKSLALENDFPGYARDLNFATTLSTSNLRSGVALLLR